MSASVKTPAGTAPSVLLIEGYAALAAAIVSALKKFAPNHRTRTVECLATAEAVLQQNQPNLLVVDFDPPQANIVEFLIRISKSFPDLRVLIIASAVSPELFSTRFGPSGVQFIEKPFELAAFGAAVQALLGPWVQATSGNSRGTLRDLNLRDLVPLECLGSSTSILDVTSDGERTGQIHFIDGQIQDATTADLNGMEALVEMMGWKILSANERQGSTDRPHTLHGPWRQLFLDALRTAKPTPEQPTLVSNATASVEKRVFPAAPTKSGKRIVVIDDTEMLAIFVEDVLSTADPELQITTALTGAEGAAQVEAIGPDLVLLDYSLPDLRGDQVCERLLRNETTARIPVVIMSGHVSEMMATWQRCPNVVATIAKPFMSGALVSLVQKTLRQGTIAIDQPKPKIVVPKTAEAPIPAMSTPVMKPEKANPSSPAKLVNPTIRVLPSVPQAISTPPVSLATSSLTEPIAPSQPRVVRREVCPARLASVRDFVVLKLGIEIVSVQLSRRFQMETIRAKPSPGTLSLTQTFSAADDQNGTGFQMGTIDLDPDGRIKTIRVQPMRRPPGSIRGHNGFDINDVKLLKEITSIQLTAGLAEPMIIQVMVAVKIVEVELSERFEVGQLVLQPESSCVRAVVNSEPGTGDGAEFEVVRTRLDSSAHLAELVLQLVSST